MKRLLLFLLLCVQVASAQTITFNSGDDSFDIEFVEIGFPGNKPDIDERFLGDDKSLGGVDYEFSISKFEATCQSKSLFLGFDCGDRGDFPTGGTDVSIVEYVNWLNELQGYPPAYEFTADRTVPEITSQLERNPEARFFLPTADEWHKAAYYDPVAEVYYDYATGSNEFPMPTPGGNEEGTVSFGRFPVHSAGGPSPFGTVGQTGNGTELEENLDFYRTGAGLPFEAHLARASSLDLTGGVGFRVVAVPPIPEPSGQFLALIAMFGFVGAFRKSRQ